MALSSLGAAAAGWLGRLGSSAASVGAGAVSSVTSALGAAATGIGQWIKDRAADILGAADRPAGQPQPFEKHPTTPLGFDTVRYKITFLDNQGNKHYRLITQRFPAGMKGSDIEDAGWALAMRYGREYGSAQLGSRAGTTPIAVDWQRL